MSDSLVYFAIHGLPLYFSYNGINIGYINAKGKKSDHCGYYVHLQPGNCLLAGGSYCPPSPLLKALRQAVYDNMDEFRGIVEDPAFKQYFPVVGENFLKTAPKGFSKDYPYLKYLQCKEYTVSCHQPDSFFLAPDFLERTDDILKYLGEHKTPGQFLCGFSMETENMLENSRKKLAKKNLDMVVANNLKVAGAGFETDTNVVTMITDTEVLELPIMNKEEVAFHIIDQILSMQNTDR